MISFEDFRAALARRIKRAGGVRPLAREVGVSPQYLSGLIHDDRKRPGPKVLEALGFEEITLYQKKRA